MDHLPRNYRIAIHWLEGKTLAELSIEHGLHVSRIHQIVHDVLRKYAVKNLTGEKQLITLVRRIHDEREPMWRQRDTPEHFYYEEMGRS
jgi:DNA-binding CsgD family transcriptional regulator